MSRPNDIPTALFQSRNRCTNREEVRTQAKPIAPHSPCESDPEKYAIRCASIAEIDNNVVQTEQRQTGEEFPPGLDELRRDKAAMPSVSI